MNFERKCAIVIGGVTGIGLSSAHLLLENGIQKVLIVDFLSEKFEELATEISQKYGKNKVAFFESDVSDPKQLIAAFDYAKKELNNVHIVFNNAGLLAETLWEKTIDINLKGSILGTKLAAELMADHGGVIVNTSSIAALYPQYWLPVYSCSKTALLTYTQCLAQTEDSNPKGIKYLTLCPGGTNTPLLRGVNKYGVVQEHIPSEKIPKVLLENQGPDDVGHAMIRMVKEAANGAIWVVNGKKTFNVHIPKFEELKLVELH